MTFSDGIFLRIADTTFLLQKEIQTKCTHAKNSVLIIKDIKQSLARIEKPETDVQQREVVDASKKL